MLDIYNSDKQLVSSSTMQNPLTSSHNGKNGAAYTFLIYVRNNNPNIYYRNVRVSPINTSNPSDTTDISGQYSTGFSIKLSYGTVPPLPFEWDTIVPGDPVTIPTDIGSVSAGDTTTYYPIWVRINVPGNTPSQEKVNLALKVDAIESAVVV